MLAVRLQRPQTKGLQQDFGTDAIWISKHAPDFAPR
jgi:hypothetical protein